MKSSMSIVIPVFNSENSIEELYDRLVQTLENIFLDLEIIFVDDNSQDNSFKKLKNIYKKDKRVKVIKLSHNFGQQNALMCGFHYTTGNYIVTMDDDLQHLPENIINLYKEIKKGYDIVYAIPTEKQQKLYRRVGSYLTDKIFNLINNKSKDITVSSFRILKRSLLKKVIQDKRSFVYLSAIILNLTNNIGNIYIEHEERKYGDSNYNLIKLFKLFSKLYIYYSDNHLCKLLRSTNPQYIIDEKLSLKRSN